MSTLTNLENDVKGLCAALGYSSADSWADRDQHFVGARSFVRVEWSEQVTQGSNLTLRLAEVAVVWARRLAVGETYQTLHQALQVDLAAATVVDTWVALASVRQSPLPEIEAENRIEKIGQVLTFTTRSRVALEG